MRIQLDTTTYDGCDLTAQVSRSTSAIPGLTTLNCSIELPIDVELPQDPQLISCVLSEDTASPLKWFTGWYLGATAKPVNNNESFLWTFKVVDVLYYLANSKSISNYSNSTTLEGHARDIAVLAERPATTGSYRYLDIEAAPADTDPFGFAIENNSLNLQAAFAELAKRSGYEVTIQEVGWTDHATLFASTSSITRIIFREAGSNEELAPVALANFDPSDPDFCDDFPFTDFSFGWEKEGITSSEVRGKGGDKAKEEGETIVTSYSKYRAIPIIQPQTDAAITEFDFAFELSADINKLNQVLVLPELGQLEVLFPYDPNTALTAGQVYFDKESSPPRVIFFQDDITGLTVDNTCYVLENFQFIKVIETDSASSTALGAATHGAFNKAYHTISDPAIADFPTATSVAQSDLAEAIKGNFFCSGKRLTTTENWLNGQLMNVTIPSQNIDKWVKVVSSSGTVKGKVFDSGENEYRDEIDYSLTFAEVDKNIFSGSFLGRLGAMARGGGNGSGGNNPAFPVYDEIPFNPDPDCEAIPCTQDGAEEVFSTTPLTELVTFPALAGIKDTIPADTTGTFDHLADFTLDLSDPALVGHPLKLYLYYGITGHETSGVTVTVQVKASPGAPEAIFSDGLTALSGDFPTAFDPETYIIQSLNTDPGEELWLPISPIDISAYIGNPDLFIRLTIAGIVETAGDRNTIAGAFFRTDCIPDCPSFVDLISLISSSGSINLIDTDEIIVEGSVAGDDNPGISASATYEIDLTHADFEGHSVNFAYAYNLFFTSSDTNTTVDYSMSVTANGDSLLNFTDTDTIVAPANSEREDTVNLDLTDYIGTVVTIMITINNTFSPSADGADASFAISGILSC